MAELALEPRDLLSEVVERSHAVEGEDAPLVLSRPPDPAPPLPPVRQSPDVAAIHAAWTRVHAEDNAHAAIGPGIRGRVRARVAARSAASVGAAQRDDRALIGDLIRATDVLAGRCDELANRVADLEALVEEIVCVVSEDLTHLRATLTGIPLSPATVGGREGAGDGGPGPGVGPEASTRDG